MFATNAYAKRVAISLAILQLVLALAACGALFAIDVRGTHTGWALRIGIASAVMCAMGGALEAWMSYIERSHRVYEIITAGIGGLSFGGIVELVTYKNCYQGYSSGLWDFATCTLVLALGAHTARLGAAVIEHNTDEPIDRSYELTHHNPWVNAELK